MMLKRPVRAAAIYFVLVALGLSGPSQLNAARTALGKRAMAATAHPLASQAAIGVMREGGNAIDAFVSAALVLGVVEPYSSGLGGGGFLLYRASRGKMSAYDFRERAPRAAHRELFVSAGEADPNLSRWSGLAVGVPGMPAGLDRVHRNHGKLKRARLVQDALKAARDGFECYPRLVERIERSKIHLERYPASRKIWLPEGRVPRVGEMVRQAALVKSLRQFARSGSESFYQGEIAEAILREVSAQGGIIEAVDLADYRVYEVQPLKAHYQDWELDNLFMDAGRVIELWEKNPPVKISKQTLVHNDFNPRNVGIRRDGRVCIYDWELAAVNIPQRDIFEFLAFSLDENFEEERLVTLLQKHFELIQEINGNSYQWKSYLGDFIVSGYEFLITRVTFYLAGNTLLNYPFIKRGFICADKIIKVSKGLYERI